MKNDTVKILKSRDFISVMKHEIRSKCEVFGEV
jgi:hypothetical protein